MVVVIKGLFVRGLWPNEAVVKGLFGRGSLAQ